MNSLGSEGQASEIKASLKRTSFLAHNAAMSILLLGLQLRHSSFSYFLKNYLFRLIYLLVAMHHELVLSFTQVNPRDQTQVLRLDSKCLSYQAILGPSASVLTLCFPPLSEGQNTRQP